jgi:hypothetical protein
MLNGVPPDLFILLVYTPKERIVLQHSSAIVVAVEPAHRARRRNSWTLS